MKRIRTEKIKKSICTLLMTALLGGSFSQLLGCSSVTVRPDDGQKDYSEPDYTQKVSYYFWGIQGEHTIDTTAVCHDHQATQMQSVTSVADWMISALTLGIYVTKTANVWCKK
jgi:hypothetical protein